MRRKILSSLVLLTALAACGKSEDPPRVRTGARLIVLWDSALDPQLISAGGTRANGDQIPKVDVPVEVYLGPPGVRSQELVLEIGDVTAEEELLLRVEGLDAERKVIAVGTAPARIKPSELSVLSMRLFLPSGPIDPEPDPVDPLPIANPFYSVELANESRTTSTEFVDVPGATLSFTPDAPGSTWLVMVSGLLRSNDPAEISAELRLMVNGEEADVFGHQTMGETENAAGFVSFHPLERATGVQTIVPQLRAVTGTTAVSNLRVVAFVMPEGADFHAFTDNTMLEAAGTQLTIGRLAFTPSRPGEYLILAKLSQRERPGGATVQTWLEDQSGARSPLDESGAGYSNGRDPWQPVFTAMRARLDTSSAAFTLRGTSSGATETIDWWNASYPYRRVLTTTDGAPTVEGASMAVTFDHAALVAAGSSRADGGDVRVAMKTGDAWIELDRVLDPESRWGTSETKLWFVNKTPNNDPMASYALYYGNLSAVAPMVEPSAVFTFFEDFSAPLSQTTWLPTRGTATVENGTLVIGAQTALRSASVFGAGLSFDAKITLELSEDDTLLSELDYFSLAAIDAEERMQEIAFSVREQTHIARSFGTQTRFKNITPEMPHVYAFDRDDGVLFSVDGVQVAEHPMATLNLDLPIAFSNGTQRSTVRVEWVRAMSIDSLEMTAGEPEAVSGSELSQWSHRKLVAFRLDAFRGAYFDKSPGLSTSKALEFTAKNGLEVPALADARDVSIQAMRIAGDASTTERKSGVLRAGGETLLSTSHKINKSGAVIGGYHHLAGVVRARANSGAVRYENGLASPDGITVEGADSTIIVLRY